MKTYEVGVWEEQGGYLEVKAGSEEEAKKLARQYIEWYGFEMSSQKHNEVKGLRVTHRDAHLI